MPRTKLVLMYAAAAVVLWLVASAFTHLAPAGGTGTLDQNECGMGPNKYDC